MLSLSIYVSIYLYALLRDDGAMKREKVMDDLCRLMTFGRLSYKRICINSNINPVSAKNRADDKQEERDT